MKNLIFFCPFIYDGGLEKTLKIYTEYFSKFYKVTLITNSKNVKKKKISKNVSIINPEIKFFYNRRYLNNFFCIFLLLKLFKSKSIVFSMQDHIFLLVINFFFQRYKIVIRTANAIINDKNLHEQKYLKKYKYIKIISSFIYKLSDLIITFSNENKKYLSKFIENKKIHVVYNYFSIKKKIKRKKKLKIYNIFFIGRLTEDKDPEFFLNNLATLKKDLEIKAHIVGKGNLSKKIKTTFINYPNLGFFHGYKTFPFKRYFKKIDIFCITSKYDGTPNVLGEALSYGIPVLAPKHVGLANYVLGNGKYGYLYKAGDGSSFKKNISNIIKNYPFAIKKASKGRLSISRFDKKRTLNKLKKLISNL